MKMKDAQEKALAKSTRKKIFQHILKYLRFCIHYNYRPLPATPYVLAAFAVFLSEKVRTIGTISGYINSVVHLHKRCGFAVPDRKDYEFKLTMTGLKNHLRRRVRKAAPMTPEILLEFRKILDLNDPLDATYWALFLVSYFLLIRASNVTPRSAKKFNVAKQLTRSDVLLGKKVAVIDIKWTKTLQSGEKVFNMPLVALQNAKLCPVWALQNMCRLVPAQQHSPAFCNPDGSAISYWQFLNKLKQLIRLTGRDPSVYSGHSFRRGGCTALFDANVRDTLIKLIGTWSSSCYLEYIAWPLKSRFRASFEFAKFMNKY